MILKTSFISTYFSFHNLYCNYCLHPTYTLVVLSFNVPICFPNKNISKGLKSVIILICTLMIKVTHCQKHEKPVYPPLPSPAKEVLYLNNNIIFNNIYNTFLLSVLSGDEGCCFSKGSKLSESAASWAFSLPYNKKWLLFVYPTE